MEGIMRKEGHLVPNVDFVFRESGEFVTRKSSELFEKKSCNFFSSWCFYSKMFGIYVTKI